MHDLCRTSFYFKFLKVFWNQKSFDNTSWSNGKNNFSGYCMNRRLFVGLKWIECILHVFRGQKLFCMSFVDRRSSRSSPWMVVFPQVFYEPLVVLHKDLLRMKNRCYVFYESPLQGIFWIIYSLWVLYKKKTLEKIIFYAFLVRRPSMVVLYPKKNIYRFSTK